MLLLNRPKHTMSRYTSDILELAQWFLDRHFSNSYGCTSGIARNCEWSYCLLFSNYYYYIWFCPISYFQVTTACWAHLCPHPARLGNSRMRQGRHRARLARKASTALSTRRGPSRVQLATTARSPRVNPTPTHAPQARTTTWRNDTISRHVSPALQGKYDKTWCSSGVTWMLCFVFVDLLTLNIFSVSVTCYFSCRHLRSTLVYLVSHPFTHLITHSVTHSLSQSVTQSLNQSFTHTITYYLFS